MADEKKLLLRLKNSDKNAIDTAIMIYTPYLSTVLYNMVGKKLPKEDIEEIISDVFIMLWKNAEYIDLSKGTIRSYIAAAARNFALKRLNGKKDDIPLEDTQIADKTNFAEKSTISDFVWSSVMSLGEPDNEIFVRYYKFGESQRAIAAATGLSISAVKLRLLRGKNKLKKILSDTEDML